MRNNLTVNIYIRIDKLTIAHLSTNNYMQSYKLAFNSNKTKILKQ